MDRMTEDPAHQGNFGIMAFEPDCSASPLRASINTALSPPAADQWTERFAMLFSSLAPHPVSMANSTIISATLSLNTAI
jgi:hypothetical protein